MAREFPDDVVDASVVAYHFEHTACHEGDNDEFAHTCDAASHGSEIAKEVESGEEQPDDACNDDPGE